MLEEFSIGFTAPLKECINNLQEIVKQQRNQIHGFEKEYTFIKDREAREVHRLALDLEQTRKEKIRLENSGIAGELSKEISELKTKVLQLEGRLAVSEVLDIKIVCPYCDLEFEYPVTKHIKISLYSIFSQHIREKHLFTDDKQVNFTLYDINGLLAEQDIKKRAEKFFYLACHKCNGSQIEARRLRKEVIEMAKQYAWVFVGENDDYMYFRGYLKDEPFGIIKVDRKHLQEIPVAVKDGKDVFEDGAAYPCSLMDFINNPAESESSKPARKRKK